ncbi:hypothetical protein H310_00025 [Aphanomyces invadans]|uniref:Ataxin-10 domain-containing protein n=1 Tax=Aphanomyces invadans TaxID=157072 RepID=A0A024UU39_9STRA|nr:hypothetical protein H310_00025 [Aphanomyces invadans]ETW09417.1 hypothetical protein H310_00025 [Aphanomyces invadans]|eukprot:XP_008860828.1 hypothetical protein H310_00025 [Aphanomyces invadans]
MSSALEEAVSLIASQSPLLSAEGLNKLNQLTFNAPHMKVYAGQIGAIAAIVDAMNRSQENGSIQEDGCRTLRTVAFHCEANLNLVQHQGAIDAVATALRLHGANEAVVAEGFWALVVFCANHLGNTLVAKGLVNVSEVMAAHATNAEIQKKGTFLNVIFA